MLGANRHSKAGLKFDAVQNPVGGRIQEQPTAGSKYRKLDNSTHMSKASIETCMNCIRGSCNGRCDTILAIEKANVDPRKRANGKANGFRGDRKYSYDGRMMTASELAGMAGITLPTFFKRLQAGWTVKEAAETPHRVRRKGTE